MKSRMIVLTLAVLLCLGIFPDEATATWYVVHGTSGHVEDEAAVSFLRTGRGLEVDVAFQPSTWVHFAVPSIGEKPYGAQYITLKYIFDTDGMGDSRITSVRIYNGDILVRTFTVNWNTPGFQSKTLNLGGVKPFPRGMGISVNVTAGDESGADKYIFVGAGANFVPIP
jgi:hypothetical protein